MRWHKNRHWLRAKQTQQKRVNLSVDPFFTAQQSGFYLVG
ncbi:hypothetical protein PSYMO_37102, partial [Pseudomonas amygdali pv. mori str. 301020]